VYKITKLYGVTEQKGIEALTEFEKQLHKDKEKYMKQTIKSKYTLELNQQEFATILAAVFSTSKNDLINYYVHGGSCILNKTDFDILAKNLEHLRTEFQTKNNIICSSDLIKGLLKE
jgi:hypothetical protein